MIKFEFETHENTSEDQYIKEIVTFKFTVQDEKSSECFYLPYFKKVGKDGQSFWDVASAGITKHGTKKYDDKFTFDSRNREKQIKTFLDSRAWEKQQQAPISQEIHYPHGLVKAMPYPLNTVNSMKEVAVEEEIPF